MRPTDAPRTRTTARRRAVTLIEAAISVAIIGLVLVGALTTLGATARMRYLQSHEDLGQSLVRDLMTEILAASYEDPVDPEFGRESEPGGNRVEWDDVDDYDGWSGSPPGTKDETPIAGAEGWTREVTVAFANPVTLAPAGQSSETDLKRISVTAIAPDGRAVTLVALRSRHGAGEQPPIEDTSFVTRVDVELRLEGMSDSASGSTALINSVAGAP